MRKNFFKTQCQEIVMLTLVRYENIGEQTKGCLFWRDTYICDTVEGKPNYLNDNYELDGCIRHGDYYLQSKRLKRVSLGGGYYRPGETRLYIRSLFSDGSYGQINDTIMNPRNGNIGVGFFNYIGHDSTKYMQQCEYTFRILAEVLSEQEYVALKVIYADSKMIENVCKSIIFLHSKPADLNLVRQLKSIRETYVTNHQLPTMEYLIDKSLLITKTNYETYTI